jgi:hypothetical protein
MSKSREDYIQDITQMVKAGMSSIQDFSPLEMQALLSSMPMERFISVARNAPSRYIEEVKEEIKMAKDAATLLEEKIKGLKRITANEKQALRLATLSAYRQREDNFATLEERTAAVDRVIGGTIKAAEEAEALQRSKDEATRTAAEKEATATAEKKAAQAILDEKVIAQNDAIARQNKQRAEAEVAAKVEAEKIVTERINKRGIFARAIDKEEKAALVSALSKELLKNSARPDKQRQNEVMEKAHKKYFIDQQVNAASLEAKAKGLSKEDIKIAESKALRDAQAKIQEAAQKKLKMAYRVLNKEDITIPLEQSFDRLNKSFKIASKKNEGIVGKAGTQVAELDKALGDPNNELFNQALRSAKLELLKNSVTPIEKFSQKGLAKFDQQANDLARKKLQDIRTHCLQSSFSSWPGLKNGFDKLKDAHDKLQATNKKLDTSKRMLESLKQSSMEAEADIQKLEKKLRLEKGYNLTKERIQEGGKSLFKAQTTRSKQLETLEGLKKERDGYITQQAEYAKLYDQAEVEFTHKRAEFDEQSRKYETLYQEKVTKPLGKIQDTQITETNNLAKLENRRIELGEETRKKAAPEQELKAMQARKEERAKELKTIFKHTEEHNTPSSTLTPSSPVVALTQNPDQGKTKL